MSIFIHNKHAYTVEVNVPWRKTGKMHSETSYNYVLRYMPSLIPLHDSLKTDISSGMMLKILEHR